MNIYDHGTWSQYVPAAWPEDYPSTALFARRDSDGVDWYVYRNTRGNISDESVKLALLKENAVWVVKNAVVEQSRLWPPLFRIMELYDGDLDTPFDSYVGKALDDAAMQLITCPAPPAVVPTSASKLGLKRAFDALGRWDQVKALIASTPNAQEEWDLATEIRRDDKIVQGIIAALNLTSDQVDTLILRAHALVA
jgi:hypothetical protein